MNGGNAVKICIAMTLREQATEVFIAMQVFNEEDGTMLLVDEFSSKDWPQAMGLCDFDKANGAIEPIGVSEGKSIRSLRAGSLAEGLERGDSLHGGVV